MVQWFLLAGAVGVALAALFVARRVSHRLERLTQAYWELRYEHTSLRARVSRLDPESTPPAEAPPAVPPQTSFVPLSSLKK